MKAFFVVLSLLLVTELAYCQDLSLLLRRSDDFVVSRHGISLKDRSGKYRPHNNNINTGNGVVQGTGYYDGQYYHGHYINLTKKNGHRVERITEIDRKPDQQENHFITATLDANGAVSTVTKCQGSFPSTHLKLWKWWELGCYTITPSLCKKIEAKKFSDALKNDIKKCQSLLAPLIEEMNSATSSPAYQSASDQDVSHLKETLSKKFNTKVRFDIITSHSSYKNPENLGALFGFIDVLSQVAEDCSKYRGLFSSPIERDHNSPKTEQ